MFLNAMTTLLKPPTNYILTFQCLMLWIPWISHEAFSGNSNIIASINDICAIYTQPYHLII